MRKWSDGGSEMGGVAGRSLVAIDLCRLSADIGGIFSNSASVMCLIGAILIDQITAC